MTQDDDSVLTCPITHIDGHAPDSLDEFTGEVQVTVTKHGSPAQLVGVGGEVANGVRFYQKDPSLHDRDIRVWMITESAGKFLAKPFSVF